MKSKRFLALAAIALLVVGVIGMLGTKAFAQSATPPAQPQECAQQDNDSVQAPNGPDTDNVDLQCDDQNTPDSGQEAQDVESADGQDAAPMGTPAISAEAAQKSAETYLNAGSAVKVELDDENGALVYSVQFANGTDVKVDALTGSVLGAETGQD